MAKLDPSVKEELKEIITHSVRETLLQLGISSLDPIETQKDMQHLRAWRTSVEGIKSKGILTIVTVLVTGMLGAFLLGLKEIFHR